MCPLQYLSDLEFGPDLKWLSADGYVFPLKGLIDLIDRDQWSDSRSEALWNESWPGIIYQLWDQDPCTGGTLALDVPSTHLCAFCRDSLLFQSLAEFFSYRLDGAGKRCSNCRRTVTMERTAIQYLYQDLTAYYDGADSTELRLFPLDPHTGRPGVSDLVDLDRKSLCSTSFWDSISSSSSRNLRWSDVLPSIGLASETAFPDESLTDICARYPTFDCSELGVNLVAAGLKHENVLAYILQACGALSSSTIGEWCIAYPRRMRQTTPAFVESLDHCPIAAPQELCWMTHMLFPDLYRSWCLSQLGHIRNFQTYLTAAQHTDYQLDLSGPEDFLERRGSSMNPFERGQTHVSPCFEHDELREGLRYSASRADQDRVIHGLALRFIRQDDSLSSSSCAYAVLEEEFDRVVSENQAITSLCIALCVSFPGLTYLPDIEAVIAKALERQTDDHARGSPAHDFFDVVPSAYRRSFEWLYLAEAAARRLGRFPDEDHRAGRKIQERALRVAQELAIIKSDGAVDIFVWDHELQSRVPNLREEAIRVADMHLDEELDRASNEIAVEDYEAECRRQEEEEKEFLRTHPECQICAESVGLKDYPEQAVTASCKHQKDVCSACVARTISTELEEQGWERLKCPVCSALLSSDDVERLADDQTISR